MIYNDAIHEGTVGTMNPDNTLGLQHVYPAGQIGLASDQELRQVAWNTVDVMRRWLDFNGTNSFYPAAVRVGYPADSIFMRPSTRSVSRALFWCRPPLKMAS